MPTKNEKDCLDTCAHILKNMGDFHPQSPKNAPRTYRQLARDCGTHGDYVYDEMTGACVTSPVDPRYCLSHERGYLWAHGEGLWTPAGNHAFEGPKCVSNAAEWCPGSLQQKGFGRFYCCPFQDAPDQVVCVGMNG